MKQLRAILTVLANKADGARASKDVVKLGCLNEKLAKTRVLVGLGEQARNRLKPSTAALEARKASYEAAKISAARAKAEQLRTEAESCTGQLAFQVQSLRMEVQAPQNLPKQDVTAASGPGPLNADAPANYTSTPSSPDLLVGRPPAASPTQ